MMKFLKAGFTVVLLTASHTGSTSDHEREWEDDDHAYDRARRAVERGEALPVADLLERLKARVPGEVVGIEFAREHGIWIYEFKIVDDRGHLLEVHLDAQTGEILSMEED